MRSQRIQRVSSGRRGVALALALLAAAGPAAAETDLGWGTLSGEAEVGGHVVWGDENAAKFKEYRDLVDGISTNIDLLLEKDGSSWLRSRAENVGYGDQRYWLEGGRYGLFEVDAFYGELPHLLSQSAMTPYLRTGGNLFELPPGFAIAAPDPALLAPVNQKLAWREGSLGGRYHAGESTLLRTSYRIQDKQGRENWGMSFGSPAGSFTSIPAQIDERIHEARAGLDWLLGEKSSISVDYLGSFFQNDFKSVTADNPNVTGGTPGDVGRAAAAPDNWAQSLGLAGGTTVPLGVPNRIAAHFAYGFRYQDEKFLPHTVNPALVSPDLDLPADSLEGKVQTLLGNLHASVQPAEDLSAVLAYRIYDFDNLTDRLLFPGNVRNDGTLREADPHTSVAGDYRRQDADLDLGWDFAENWQGTVGFGWERWDRDASREVRHLDEYGPSLGLDYRRPGGLQVLAGYDFRTRDGSEYRPLAPIDKILGPGEVCPGNILKFCELRKFDEANRYLHRFDLLGRLAVTEAIELGLTGDLDYSDYHDSSFGLTEAAGYHLGGDLFYELGPRANLIGYYTYEWRRLWKKSRERGVAGDVATEGPDWRSHTSYGYHDVGATLRLAVLPEKLDADVGYLLHYGREKTRASGGSAVNLPSVHDLLQAVEASLAWHASDLLTVRGGYRFEDYDVTKFRDENVPASLSDGTNLFLGDLVGGYTAHILGISTVLTF